MASSRKHEYEGARLQRVMEAARLRAREVGKLVVADAVHEIWLESQKNGHLMDLLDAILTQTATPAQVEDFRNYVKRAKERLRTKAEKEARRS